MIAQLRGEIVSIIGENVVIDVNGVGYEVICTQGALSNLSEGQQAVLIVYTEVREDSLKLYGFLDRLEREVFLLLQKVKGVAGRSAREMVSGISARELLRAIGSGDTSRLQSVRGVGKKTAERIVLELKDRVAEYALPRLHSEGSVPSGSAKQTVEQDLQDAVDALISLGFSRRDAQRAAELAQGNGASGSSDLLRIALQHI